MDSRGPAKRAAGKGAPEFLKAKEVDALYDLIETVSSLLDGMGVTWTLIAGSALGAVRQHSILFCDDDLDIAVLEQDYPRVVSELPPLLKQKGAGIFLKRGQTGRGCRPWDKIRPSSCSHLWLDIFILKRYNSPDEVEEIRGDVLPADVKESMSFPLYHYDSRMALGYWPREWLSESELLPTQRMQFAQMMLPMPKRPVPYLIRSYGARCFQEYPTNQNHSQWQKEFASRAASQQQGSNNKHSPASGSECSPTQSGAASADDVMDNLASSAPCYLPLEERHYLPIMHSKRSKRITSDWCKERLKEYLEKEGYLDEAFGFDAGKGIANGEEDTIAEEQLENPGRRNLLPPVGNVVAGAAGAA